METKKELIDEIRFTYATSGIPEIRHNLSNIINKLMNLDIRELETLKNNLVIQGY